MDERVERTVDSFFEDDDNVSPRGEIETTRSVGSAISSVSSTASSRSSVSEISKSSAYDSSAPVSPRDADPSDDDSSTAPSTARSSASSDDSSPTEQQAEPAAVALEEAAVPLGKSSKLLEMGLDLCYRIATSIDSTDPYLPFLLATHYLPFHKKRHLIVIIVQTRISLILTVTF